MDTHRSCLKSLRRICARSSSSRKQRFSACKNHRKELLAFGIDIEKDSVDVHPEIICQACQQPIIRCEASKRKQLPYRPLQKEFQWAEYSNDECITCSIFAEYAKGGRMASQSKRQKLSGHGRPCLRGHLCLERYLERIALPSFRPQGNFRLYPVYASDDINAADVLQKALCPICNDILDRPVEAICRHLACMKCLLEQFKSHPPEVEWQCSSPGCNAPLLLSSAELKSFGESEEFSRIHKLTETALRKIKAKNVI